eukprot:s491_g9.t1
MERLKLPQVVAALEGVDLPEVRAEAVALRKRLAASAEARPVAAKSTDEQLREREEASHDGFKLLSNSGDQKLGSHSGGGLKYVAMKVMMQQMMKMLPKKELAKMFGPLAAREVSSFHLDFPKQFGWPVAVDVARASKLLEVTYSIATTSPWMMNHAIKTGDFEFEFEDWQKRFHFGGLGLERMKLVFEEGRQFRPGDVIDMEFCSRDFKVQYDTRIRNSFANSLNRKEVMQQGTVHVAVGFNDLGALLTGDFRPSTQHDHGPLRFIGYEMNAFNVAKTRIIERLLKDPQVPLIIPLQIWFSSSWTSLAEEVFRRAAAAGMASATPADIEVKAYFSHWISAAPVPLSEARALWLNYHEDGRDWSAIACMARDKDRMALCHYYVTGDVLGGESPNTGSLAMWSVPPGSPPLQKGENCIVFEDLLTEVGTETGSDIQVAMEALLLRRLQRLRGLLQRGEELHMGMLSFDNKALLSRIAELRPWTMSWSNVLDHMHLRDFHDMARACSIHGNTIHYGYSMNWITGVWGTCIMDFPQEMRGELIDLADKGLIEAGHLSFEGLPRSDMLLVLPPHDTPLNYTGFVLSLSHGSKWADYFCSAALGTPVPRLGQASPLSLFCPLHQASHAQPPWSWRDAADDRRRLLPAGRTAEGPSSAKGGHGPIAALSSTSSTMTADGGLGLHKGFWHTFAAQFWSPKGYAPLYVNEVDHGCLNSHVDRGVLTVVYGQRMGSENPEATRLWIREPIADEARWVAPSSGQLLLWAGEGFQSAPAVEHSVRVRPDGPYVEHSHSRPDPEAPATGNRRSVIVFVQLVQITVSFLEYSSGGISFEVLRDELKEKNQKLQESLRQEALTTAQLLRVTAEKEQLLRFEMQMWGFCFLDPADGRAWADHKNTSLKL